MITIQGHLSYETGSYKLSSHSTSPLIHVWGADDLSIEPVTELLKNLYKKIAVSVAHLLLSPFGITSLTWKGDFNKNSWKFPFRNGVFSQRLTQAPVSIIVPKFHTFCLLNLICLGNTGASHLGFDGFVCVEYKWVLHFGLHTARRRWKVKNFGQNGKPIFISYQREKKQNWMEKKPPQPSIWKHPTQFLKAFPVLRHPKRSLREDETSCDEMGVAVECDKEC